MVNPNTGITFTPFSTIITRYGADLSHIPVTKTISNIDGDETLTDGTTATIRAYLSRKTAPWNFDQAGLIAGGDAIMLVLPTDSVKKDDKILHNGVLYRIQYVINRDQGGGNVAFTSCNLFKIE